MAMVEINKFRTTRERIIRFATFKTKKINFPIRLSSSNRSLEYFSSEMRYTAPAAWGRSFSLPTREGTDTPAQAALNNKQIE